MKILLVSTLLATTLGFSAVANDDIPPTGSLKLSEVIQKLELEGFHPVVDVEFDDGVWEIDAYRGREKRELHVDPKTGKILRDRED